MPDLKLGLQHGQKFKQASPSYVSTRNVVGRYYKFSQENMVPITVTKKFDITIYAVYTPHVWMFLRGIANASIMFHEVFFVKNIKDIIPCPLLASR